MHFTEINDGTIRVRRLEDNPEDMAIMGKWLTDPRVLEFYEGRDNPFPPERVREKFINGRAPWEYACLFDYAGQPIGYVQFYPVEPDYKPVYGYALDQEVWGMDQFIGEPEFWNRGIGTQMIRLVVAFLFAEAKAERVVLDPVVSNLRAIRAYEKCGFRKVKIVPEHEFAEGVWHDSWLMEVTPETFQP